MNNQLTREEREKQLKKLSFGNLCDVYCKAKGISLGVGPPIGILSDQMIEEILRIEFPKS